MKYFIGNWKMFGIPGSIKILDRINNYVKKDKVRSKNINQLNKDLVLELIGIDHLKNNDDYEINLIFKNNAHIALTTETIEARLEDQNEIKKL